LLRDAVYQHAAERACSFTSIPKLCASHSEIADQCLNCRSSPD
jgi:hypothetical protein